MSVWIVPLGTNSVQLKNREHWVEWCNCSKLQGFQYYKDIPPRILARVEKKRGEKLAPYLVFPLLDKVKRELKEQDPLLFVLTDGSPKDESSYWDDTIELEELLYRQFNCQTIVVNPINHNWNSIACIVEQCLKAYSSEDIIVVPQDGTPIVSSAVQAASIWVNPRTQFKYFNI